MNKVHPNFKKDQNVMQRREEKLDMIEKTNISVLINLQKRYDKITSAIVKLKNTIKHNKRKKACIICFLKLQRIIIMPCQHSDYCEKCIKRIIVDHNNQCPLCRGEIESYIKL